MNKCFIYILIVNGMCYISMSLMAMPLCLQNEKLVNWHRYFHVENKALNITIDVTNRKSHRIVSHILKILLMDRLKYQNVFLKRIPWLTPSENLQRLHSKGNISQPDAHINLEVWQPPGFNVEAWVNKGLVLDCGPLGPIARRGIFALTETMEEMFESTNRSLDHWRAFRYPLKSWNYTILYEWLTENQRWKPMKSYSLENISNVPIILIDREEFQKPIERLFSKVYSKEFFRIILINNVTGSLKRTIDDWIVYSRSISHPPGVSPIFFYDWYPSTVTVNRKYSRILFPDCYGIKDDPLCDFEVNQLSKMVWVKLKSHASLAYQLVNQFKISQAELVDLLNKIGDEQDDNQFHNIACDWLKTKKHLWTQWTVGWDTKQKLIIPAFFSMYGKWVPGGLVDGSQIELKSQNDYLFKNSSYELVLDIRNLTCVEDIVLKEYLHFSTIKLNSSIILAYLAAVCSDSLESTLKVSTFQRRIVVTSSADSPKFGNVTQYKYFFRTLPSMNLQMSLLLSTFREWNWKRIVILRKDSMFYESKFFESHDIHVIEDFAMEESRLTFENVYQFLKRMRDQKNGRIFLVEYFAESTRIVMCAAFKLQMTLANGYVWFLNSWMNNTWNNMRTKNCTEKEILNSTSKHFMLAHRDMTRYKQGVAANIDLRPDSVADQNQNMFKDFTVEAIRKISRATDKLLKENPSALSVLDSPTVAEKFISYIANLNPNPNIPRMPDVVEGFWVLLAINNSWKTPVFKWNVSSNFSFSETNSFVFKPTILLVGERLKYFWGKSNKFEPPLDGSVVDNVTDCVLDGLRQLIGVSCSSVIILFNVIILVPIVAAIVGCFVFFFRRLKKTQEEEGIRKPFEFLCQELAELDLQDEDVVINRTVGRGNFGIVYGGEARQDNKWVLVAIKAISKKLDFRHKYEFLSEAKLMSNLDNENIVKLIGVCLNPHSDMIYLIMEHVTGGDLKKFLIKRRVKAKEDPMNEIICPKRLTKYARDIASGLLYLHESRYLHRDVACRNCLISADYCIKVGDFGLARKMVKNSHKGGNGYYRFSGLGAMPIRWLPPESLQFGIYSVNTDIWSYGVTLYEIVTFGVFPFGGYEHEEVVDKVKRCRFTVANFLPESFRNTTVFGIISKCCSYNAGDRFKSMQEIINILDDDPECVQPSLTDDPPNIQNTSFPSILGSESSAFMQRKMTAVSSRYIPDLSSSGGQMSVPAYDCDPVVKYGDVDNTGSEDFFGGFQALDPNISSRPSSNMEQAINVRSQSSEYIHSIDTELTNTSPTVTRDHDVECDQGYVTYKTVDRPYTKQVSEIITNGPVSNYLEMNTKIADRYRLPPAHSCSFDLSTDTGCSVDADCSGDKSSQVTLAGHNAIHLSSRESVL